MPAARDDLPLVLGTAGHIDHGKTVLVEALTGVNTDRLPEERRRGISIELGFARLELPSGRIASIVDVPGHERFVRTMVAGATGIDMFLLVVAADDGVMPQTREHLTVIRALGVERGVVALTKADLFEDDGELELAREEVRELLAGGPYSDAEIVPVSAPRREGLEALRRALGRAAEGLAGRGTQARAGAPARLHVDRSFTLKGIGTVVTGTLWSGEVHVGQEVRIEPGGRSARIRSVQVHDTARRSAVAGQRVALNLVGVARSDVTRGDVVTDAPGLGPTYRVDARVELRSGAEPLRRGTRVQVHHGTREAPARVTPLEGEAVEPGAAAFVQLRLEHPLVPAAGDRLVIRLISPPDTIGGGEVIDPGAARHGAGGRQTERLRVLAGGDALERLALALGEASSGLGPEAGSAGDLDRLVEAGRAERIGAGAQTRWFEPGRLAHARRRILEALATAGGRPASRGALARTAALEEPVAAVLLERLVADGSVQPLGRGFLAADANGEQDPLEADLLESLEHDNLEPRAPDTLAAALGTSPERVREALDRLALADGVVRVKPGVYYHRVGLDEARRRVVAVCERDGAVTIAGLRDELGTSRKYAQALLEHFDTERLTRRRGDEHVLRRRL